MPPQAHACKWLQHVCAQLLVHAAPGIYCLSLKEVGSEAGREVERRMEGGEEKEGVKQWYYPGADKAQGRRSTRRGEIRAEWRDRG